MTGSSIVSKCFKEIIDVTETRAGKKGSQRITYLLASLWRFPTPSKGASFWVVDSTSC